MLPMKIFLGILSLGYWFGLLAGILLRVFGGTCTLSIFGRKAENAFCLLVLGLAFGVASSITILLLLKMSEEGGNVKE